jgi:hypothetical protein
VLCHEEQLASAHPQGQGQQHSLLPLQVPGHRLEGHCGRRSWRSSKRLPNYKERYKKKEVNEASLYIKNGTDKKNDKKKKDEVEVESETRRKKPEENCKKL